MKLAVFSDMHIGVHGVDEFVHASCSIPWVKWFVSECQKREIKKLWFLGDLFNTRATINTLALNWALKFMHEDFAWFDEINIIVGNHDAYYKNTNDVSSVNVFNWDQKITIYSSYTQIRKYGVDITVLPWIAKLSDEQLDSMVVGKTDICFGHIEVNTFETHRNSFYTKGLTLENITSKFKKTMSGHFHVRQERGSMIYVGNPYEMSWSDYGNTKGFYILDTDTLEHEFVQGKVTPVHEKYTVQQVLNGVTPLNASNNWLKLIIDRGIDSDKDIEKAFKKLLTENPIEIRKEIIYGTADDTEVKLDTTKLHDPLSLLLNYVAQLEITDEKKLKIGNIFSDVYKKVKKE
jgi:predicted phosphodiesterase